MSVFGLAGSYISGLGMATSFYPVTESSGPFSRSRSINFTRAGIIAYTIVLRPSGITVLYTITVDGVDVVSDVSLSSGVLIQVGGDREVDQGSRTVTLSVVRDTGGSGWECWNGIVVRGFWPAL